MYNDISIAKVVANPTAKQKTAKIKLGNHICGVVLHQSYFTGQPTTSPCFAVFNVPLTNIFSVEKYRILDNWNEEKCCFD